MIYVLIVGAAVVVVLAWVLVQRRNPSTVRSTEDFRATMKKISPDGDADAGKSANASEPPRGERSDEDDR